MSNVAKIRRESRLRRHRRVRSLSPPCLPVGTATGSGRAGSTVRSASAQTPHAFAVTTHLSDGCITPRQLGRLDGLVRAALDRRSAVDSELRLHKHGPGVCLRRECDGGTADGGLACGGGCRCTSAAQAHRYAGLATRACVCALGCVSP